jgi:hypothetical protein
MATTGKGNVRATVDEPSRFSTRRILGPSPFTERKSGCITAIQGDDMFKLAGLVLSVILICAAGCQLMGAKKDAPAAVPDDKGIASVTNQGTIVYLPGHGMDVKTLSTAGTTVCQQCKIDAASYFQNGMLTEKCSVCGANRFAMMRGK